jgi:thiamine biosynthesis lipoprotein
MFWPFKSVKPARSRPPQNHRLHRLHGPTMGTTWTAQFVAAEPQLGEIAAGLQAAVDLVDGQMSTWKPGSDLSRFNASPVGSWVPVPTELAFVVQQGLAVGRATSGAFDITVGAQVNAWGFGPAGMTELPHSAQPTAGIAALEVQTDPPSLRKSAALSLDLSGIAKGFGVDQMAMVLDRAGIDHYLITLDGELRCKGRKPGLDGVWTVALDAPIPGEHRIWDGLKPQDGALATSGDYRHFRVAEGKTLSHTIDPATGRPLENAIASVTVWAPDCWRADAWATALMVMGPQKGVAIAEARNIAALFLIRSSDGVIEAATGAFGQLCNRTPAL